MLRAARSCAFLTLAALAAATGCGKKEEAAAPPPPAVEVAAVVQKDVPIYGEWIGSLDGSVNAEIRPQIEGYVLKQVYREGFVVRAGEPLFEIDPRQFQASYDQTRASLSQYEATLANAKTTAARYRPLAKEKAISQQELDDAETKERTASANVESAKAAMEKAKLDLEWTKIVSPIDGIAGVAKSQVGDLVNRLTVMTTVSQVDPIKVNFSPSEQEYLEWVAKHGSVEKTLSANEDLEKGPLQLMLADGSVFPHHGRAILIGREVDAKTGTIQLAGAFPNPGNILRPGQYAKVRVSLDVKKNAILVPQRAVSELQGSYQVAVVGSDNKATIKVVKTGPVDGNMWVIEEGLKPGDRIIVEGLQRVRSGMTVNPTQASAPEGGGKAEPAKTEPAKETKG
ncbi:MAG TPA: efflux RND transporter periplasmic adaptor subunit [Thermoanaerobaculia bacterium]|nr:efflux RND transporter periplasmic adaptor subunit [Thermoanaerobaculia bacterium]